jgi:hypothetical protein
LAKRSVLKGSQTCQENGTSEPTSSQVLRHYEIVAEVESGVVPIAFKNTDDLKTMVDHPQLDKSHAAF